jgi:uncharacterized protein YbaP (TraB family)
LILAINGPLPAAPASKPGPPFLWKIEGGRAPSWIFGTIHLARPDVATPTKPVRTALDSADAVYTEIPMDPATLASLAPALRLPADKSLTDILGPSLTTDLKSEFHRAGKSPAELAALDRVKPWFVAVSLLELDEPDDHSDTPPLDLTIFQRATHAGKITGGLETPAEQLAIFDSLSRNEQAALVEETLAQIRAARAAHQSLTDTLVALYLAGDLPKLTAELSKIEAGGTHPAFSARLKTLLLDQRNVRLADRMIQKLRTHSDRSFFFAVGAAHLDGPTGILAALEKGGFHLTRVE